MMRHLSRVVGIFICLILFFSPLAWCQSATGGEVTRAQITARSQIWKDITSGRAGSANVAILDNGQFVYSEGFGMADRENSIPADRNTLFNIGSVSKVYCTTAIMLLVDEGKVALDKPLITYLPEFKMADERYKDITVRMLLNHSSGLAGTNYVNSCGFAYNGNFYQETLDIMAQSHLIHQPGEMAVYCNDGFTLAEMIVAKVSGKAYGEFLKERIFRPLSLEKTDFAVGQRPLNGLTAARYYNEQGTVEPLEALSFLASGGISTTAEELCLFADSFSDAGRHILSSASLAEMNKLQVTPFGGELRNSQMSLGLGWEITDIPEYRRQGIHVLGKSGGTGRYTSMVYIVPDQRIAVAVNTTGFSSAEEITKSVLDAYLDEKGLITLDASSAQMPVKAQPLPEGCQEYAGFYAGSDALLYKISLDEKKGLLTFYSLENGQENHKFTAVYGADSYFYTPAGKKYYFTTAENTRYFVVSEQFDMPRWQKLEPIAHGKRQTLAVDIDGQQWLRRNVKSYEGVLYTFTHFITSRLVKGLDGYVDFMGIKPVFSPTFAGLPGKSVRDATELKLLNHQGKNWFWLSGGLYMNVNEAAAAQIGDNRIILGEQGYNEWLRISKGAVLHFDRPDTGRIIVFDSAGVCLYDSVANQGNVFVPSGSLVEMAGDQGDIFIIQVLGNY